MTFHRGKTFNKITAQRHKVNFVDKLNEYMYFLKKVNRKEKSKPINVFR